LAETLLSIRNGNSEDLTPILDIEKKSFDDPYTLDMFATLLESFPDGFRVYVMGDKVVGYCVSYPVNQKRAMVIVSIAVHPDYRNRGIGTSLLKDSISISSKLHSAKAIDKLILQVAEENNAARSLYEKFGFKNRSLIKNYYGRRKHGIEMHLDLDRG
jgi:[ribosomal protein S18]-alanine N-acetyltransferase